MTAGSTESGRRYMFDTSWGAEQRRLLALETIWDPYTFASLRSVGVRHGARCLEVGAGNGSVATWLCGAVGPSGTVVATDLDTRFLSAFYEPNLEVRAHDISRDSIEEGAYDLVHTRLLLSHLPGHIGALRRMTAALKPGGWLLVEEFDHASFLPDPARGADEQAVWDAWSRAFQALAARRRLDLTYGRRLRGLLQAHGLTDVQAEGRTVFECGGTPGRDLLLLSAQSLRESVVETGEIDDAGVDRLLEMLSEPAFAWQSQVMVAARGRRPA